MDKIPYPKFEYQEQLRQRLNKLAVALAEKIGTFPFPGIEKAAYVRLKEDEELLIEQGFDKIFVSSIDETLATFNENGISIQLNHDKMNALAIPTGGQDPTDGSISFKVLKIIDDMDPHLKRLVKLDRLLHHN